MLHYRHATVDEELKTMKLLPFKFSFTFCKVSVMHHFTNAQGSAHKVFSSSQLQKLITIWEQSSTTDENTVTQDERKLHSN